MLKRELPAHPRGAVSEAVLCGLSLRSLGEPVRLYSGAVHSSNTLNAVLPVCETSKERRAVSSVLPGGEVSQNVSRGNGMGAVNWTKTAIRHHPSSSLL